MSSEVDSPGVKIACPSIKRAGSEGVIAMGGRLENYVS